MDITTYILAKKYVEDSLAGAGALKGLSAYEIAQRNGFIGSEKSWLESLRGTTPHIGKNGNWFIGDSDTGVIASPSLAGYATEEFVNKEIAKIDLSPYATKKELAAEIKKIVIPDVSGFVTQDDIDKAIDAIPEVDLSSFATKKELQEAIKNIDIPKVDLSGYYTKEEVEQKLKENTPNLEPYALKTDIPNVDSFITQTEINAFGFATEEFVKEQIAKAELGGENAEIDLSAFYTKTEADAKIAEEISKIEHPTVDLSDYAKKSDIPDISSLATEKYVNTLVSDLINSAPETLNTLGEIAEEINKNKNVVDTLNSAIGNKADRTELEGLASEDYVKNAISNIENPKVDLTDYATKEELEEALENSKTKIYEVQSDSSDIEEVAPKDVQFASGDVLIVTNSQGVKSAYHYGEQGWVACDGNVDASKVIMPVNIVLAGQYTQFGNLTKEKTGTAIFETKGMSVASALQTILSKREQPVITSNPTISLTFSQSGDYEVGTSVAPSYKASLSSGSYTYGPATNVTATSWNVSDSKSNVLNTSSGNFPQFVVEDDTNYQLHASVSHNEGAIALDNLGGTSNPIIRIQSNSARSVSSNHIRGYRSWFVYVGNNINEVVDSNFIRKTVNKGNGANASTQNNVAIPAGTKRILVAIPKEVLGSKFNYGKSLKSVIDVDGMSLDVIGNFTKKEVMIEGLNGYAAVPYNVWICENANGLAATKYNLIIS